MQHPNSDEHFKMPRVPHADDLNASLHALFRKQEHLTKEEWDVLLLAEQRVGEMGL